MSALDFVASLVGSLAWPAAVVVILVVFRKTIARLLSGQVRRMKAGPVEVEWDRTIAEAEVELDQAGDAPPEARDGVVVGVSDELAELARRSPATAVLEAHARIERALRELLRGREPDSAHAALSAPGLARLAHRRGLITDETVRAVSRA